MEKSPKRLIYYGITLVLISSAALMSSLGVGSVVYGLILLASVFVYLGGRSENIFHVFWLLGFTTFILLPYLTVFPLSPEAISADVVMVSVAYTSLAFFLTANCTLDFSLVQKPGANGQFVLMILFSAASVLGFFCLLVMGLSANLVFLFLISLLYFFLRASNPVVSTVLVGEFLAVLVSYSLLVWTGFGRINIAAWMLISIVLYFQRFNLGYSKFIVLIASLLGPGILAIVRGRGGLAEQFLSGHIDSNLSPILLATDLARSSAGEPGGLFDLLGQFSLLFITLVPRAIFPDKPNGFGFEFTLRELDVTLARSGHSVAGLFMGDHLYFLGSIGLLTASFSVLLVCLLYVWAIRSSRFHLLGGLVALQLPTFVWNGIGSFSQRLSLSLFGFFAALAVYFLVRRLIRALRRQAFQRRPLGAGSRYPNSLR